MHVLKPALSKRTIPRDLRWQLEQQLPFRGIGMLARMDPQKQFCRQQQLVKETLLLSRISAVEVLRNNLISNVAKVDPIGVREDGDEVNNLHLHASMRIALLLWVLYQGGIQVGIELLLVLD